MRICSTFEGLVAAQKGHVSGGQKKCSGVSVALRFGIWFKIGLRSRGEGASDCEGEV